MLGVSYLYLMVDRVLLIQMLNQIFVSALQLEELFSELLRDPIWRINVGWKDGCFENKT